MNLDFEGLLDFFTVHWEKLSRFQFNYDNPIFWVILVAMFLFLSDRWSRKKAFSYCLLVGGSLLVMTFSEPFFAGNISTQGGLYDPLWVRIAVGVFCACVTLFYFFVNE